jgi:hypothetical protein
MKVIRSCLVALGAAISCTNPVCGCLGFVPSGAVVWGRITMDSGAPAPQAALRAATTAATTPCAQGDWRFLGLADAQGRYRLMIPRESPIDSACVFLRASYPGEAPPTRDTVLGPFRLILRRDPPFDSVKVDFVLSP